CGLRLIRDRRGDGHGYAAGRTTRSEELRGGGAAVRAMRPAGARTTPGCGRGSVWGDGASGRSPREGRGAYGTLRHGRSGAQVASHPAGVHRNRSDAERTDPGRAITSTHAKASQIAEILTKVSGFLKRIKTTAEQLTQKARWALIHRRCQEFCVNGFRLVDGFRLH